MTIGPILSQGDAPAGATWNALLARRDDVRAATSARTDANAEQQDESRMAAIAEMIKNLTGRDVKFVPPAAYLLSGPKPAPTPPRTRPVEVELAAPRELLERHARGDGPLEVDITSVLATGTSDRMLLTPKGAAGLSLTRAVDVEI